MIKVKIIPFNPFQVNTYLLFDETGHCAIIDAACYGYTEEQQLKDFINKEKLTPVVLLNTHCHIDHILGNNFIYAQWKLRPQMHKDGLVFLENAIESGRAFGFNVDEPVKPETFLEEGQSVSFGNQTLKILEAPGHADGSLCFYHEDAKFVVAGDVLFHNSIGRTDLPTGDFDTLVNSIHTKLFTLPDEVKVYCGHGSDTTIGDEKKHNPFV